MTGTMQDRLAETGPTPCVSVHTSKAYAAAQLLCRAAGLVSLPPPPFVSVNYGAGRRDRKQVVETDKRVERVVLPMAHRITPNHLVAELMQVAGRRNRI